ncbi:MAG: hypothetical protein ACFE8O_10360 [Candidatus Hermodarchaeota archaeon]
MRVIETANVAVLIQSFIETLLSIGTTQACWWRRPLFAEMDVSLRVRPAEPSEPGYDSNPNKNALRTWEGAISGDINGQILFSLTNFIVEGPNNEWGHFWEISQIHDENGVLLMETYNEGYTHQTKGYYGIVGKVTYTSPEFARWQGHTVFMHGKISPRPAKWQTSSEIPIAPGKFYVF